MNLPRDPRLDDPEWLRRKYWEAGLTTGEIAADIGGACTQAMVQKAMIRLDIPRRPPGRRPVKDGATRGASADLSTSQTRLLAEYEEWLKSRGYSYTTVYGRVRGGRKILRAYPRGVPTKGDALDALAPADRYSRGTRNAARTIVHSFYEYLESQGAL